MYVCIHKLVVCTANKGVYMSYIHNSDHSIEQPCTDIARLNMATGVNKNMRIIINNMNENIIFQSEIKKTKLEINLRFK